LPLDGRADVRQGTSWTAAHAPEGR
jgi:hypothetical protein